MKTTTNCPCCSGLAYAECCQPYHSENRLPTNAEALMRSRYSAYCRQDSAYLLATWEPGKRPKTVDFSKETAQWTKLEITETKKGGGNDKKGLVSFKAFFIQDGEAFVMRETSRFTKCDGRWFYVDGVGAISQMAASDGTARNRLCPCGSGKKFKRCCGS